MEIFALLACATLFGGMMLYSFGFAAFVFRTLPAAEAGTMLRQAFPWYYGFVIAGGLVAGLGLAVLDPGRAAILLAVALSAVYARQILMPQINGARDRQMSGDTSARRRFGRLHGWSVVLNFLQLAAIGWVLAAFL